VSYEAHWALAFAATLLMELLVAVPLLRQVGATWTRRAAAVTLANLASHPLVWFVLPRAVARSDFPILAEAWAVAAEAAVYALVFPAGGLTRAVGVSAVANAASFVGGFLVEALIPTL
jgi:hypothetical protein